MLELTSQILGANPDFATLWNCRREVLQRLEVQKCVGVQSPGKMALALPLPSLGPGLEEEWGSQGHRQRAVEGWVQKDRGELRLGVGGP